MPVSNPGVGATVTTAEIEDGQITTAKLANGAVTPIKSSGIESSSGTQYYPQDTTIGNYSAVVAAVGSSFEKTVGTPAVTEQTSTDSGFSTATGSGGTRAGIKVATGSAMIDQEITKIELALHKSGSPTGTASVVVRDSGDSVVFTLGTVDVSTLASSWGGVYTAFENLTGYTLQEGDRILFEFTGGDASNYVNHRFQNSNPYDSTNTHWCTYNGSYTEQTGQEETFKITLAPVTQYPVANSWDGSAATEWRSDAGIAENIYFDMGATKDIAALAVYLGTNNTETTIKIRLSTSTSFDDTGLVRTMLATTFASGDYTYIVFNRPLSDMRYIQLIGASGNSLVLALHDIQWKEHTESEWNRSGGYKKITKDSTDFDAAGDAT